MLRLVISGGQAGADQAGWRAARAAGLETGGWMPRGFPTEDGPRPEFAGLYGAVEHESPEYPPRTRANVRDSGGTIWFGAPGSPGGRNTLRACRDQGRPYLIVIEGRTSPADAAAWLDAEDFETLNVAGNRESTSPGIGERAERFLAELFRLATIRGEAAD